MIIGKSTYKNIAISLLVLFGIFIITPAVVTIIQKNADVSMFYSATEEESKETVKVIDDRIIKSMYETCFCLSSPFNESIATGYREILHNSFLVNKFCPPPEVA
ncbi:hypothetical protein ED312_07940 [Sinomicrobium pectinilyticum]|uniref:Uncharacterized protein n=1 Tax=Sinomicrobium pectinilyticum TaxID=1084421 RepID=A0A3N0EM25_SINP1|nr:hypothetical protein [Sinomicrobium pectinilyticum]RNL88709.1 hypothetical protein ED312_07940 [Sinomicrobium pectinilyticum]